MSATTRACVTAVPGKYGRVPTDACNSNYNYDPNYGLAIAYAFLFGVITVTHLYQAITLKKKFAWVVIMGGAWELSSFITRALGAHDQQNNTLVIISQLFLFLAPLWINAFCYMLLGRMIHFFLPSQRVFRIKGSSLATYFVGADVISFFIQAVGVSMIRPDTSASTRLLGIHTYQGGVGAQQFFILLFLILVIKFNREMVQLGETGVGGNTRKGWRRLTALLYLVLGLITIQCKYRIIYRLAEFAAGIGPNNPLPNHEVYVYVFDMTPMLVALVALSALHPGYVLVGPSSSFPKLSKAEKKAKKEQRKVEKAEKKRGKADRKAGAGGSSWAMQTPPQKESV